MGWTRTESDDNEMTWSEEGNLVSRRITFVETAGAGVYTGTVEIPAGGVLHTLTWETTAAWDAVTALLDAGYTGVLTAYGIDVVVDAVDSSSLAGIVPSVGNPRQDYFAAGTTLTLALTTTGAGGTTGRTFIVAVYSVPPAATEATKA